jgi:hypothetical protein
MSTVLRFTQLDLRVQRATLRSTLAVAALLALLTWVTAPIPPMIVAVFTFAAAIVAVEPFRSDERGRLDTLYALLPVGRAHVVWGRYLTMLGIQVAFAVVGVALALAAAAVKAMPLDGSLTGLILTAGFALNALILAIEAPVVFRMGYARARWVAFTPILVIVALVAVANASGLNLSAVVSGLPAAALPWAPLPVAGLAALAVSALVSVRLYTARDL